MLQRYQMDGISVHQMPGCEFQSIQQDSFMLYRTVPSKHYNLPLEQPSLITFLFISLRGQLYARLASNLDWPLRFWAPRWPCWRDFEVAKPTAVFVH